MQSPNPTKLRRKPERQEKSLASLSGWNIETTEKFERYLQNYEALPAYKKVLNSMIKFSEMYQPLRKGRWEVDIFDQIGALNEERQYQRAQIYMNKRDIINTFDSTHGKRLIITSRGHKIFYKEYPLARLRKEKWSGNWTVVMYDFPEKLRVKRKHIREKLRGLGFGSFQLSILISPLPLEDPIQKLIEGEGTEKFVWVLTCRQLWGMTDQEAAQKAWPLAELNDLYGLLLKAFPLAKEEGNEILFQWKKYLLAVNTADPYLPFELLPQDWLGEKCEEEFVKLGPKGFLHVLLRKIAH